MTTAFLAPNQQGSDLLSCAVIDDDPDDRLILRTLIAQGPFRNCHITEIPIGTDRQQCIERLLASDFDLCFLDHNLGAYTGPDLLQAQPEICQRMAVIVFTIAEDLATAEQALASGALDYLPKKGLDAIAIARSMRYACHLHRTFARLHEQHEDNVRSLRSGMLGALAGGIAHEFNNLNAVILGHAELLCNAAGGGAAPLRHLNTICDSIDRATGIINGMRQLAEQSDSGRSNIAEIVGNVFMLHGPSLQRQEIAVAGLDSMPDIWVEVDPGTLTTICSQIVQNAIHAVLGVNNRSIECQINADGGDYCRLRLRDNGIGMDDEQLASIATPFVSYKGPFDHARHYPDDIAGVGLGLAVCQHLLDECGGSMHIDSDPGHGTEVSLRLPMAERQDASSLALPALQLGSSPADIRVLVAEDEIILRQLLQMMVSDIGSAVRTCEDLTSLLVDIKSWHPHVLVMDWYLGGNDGFQVIASLRYHIAVEDLHLIVCSASPPQRQEIASLGFASTTIIRKPARRQQLESALMTIAGYWKRQR